MPIPNDLPVVACNVLLLKSFQFKHGLFTFYDYRSVIKTTKRSFHMYHYVAYACMLLKGHWGRRTWGQISDKQCPHLT